MQKELILPYFDLKEAKQALLGKGATVNQKRAW